MVRTQLLNLLYKKNPNNETQPLKPQNKIKLKRKKQTQNKQKFKPPPKLQRSISSAGIKQHSVFEVTDTWLLRIQPWRCSAQQQSDGGCI